MLITVPQHTKRDLLAWDRVAQQDAVVARTERHRGVVARAEVALLDFVARGPCYCGVSWGKDSVVVADMVARLVPEVPLVCIVGRPIDNPYSPLVRDAFLVKRPRVEYHEIESWCRAGENGEWHATGTLERGFAEARKRLGPRHISGIRGSESRQRAMRMRSFGESSSNTCAPIGWWTGADVFAYLSARDLPVHPSYAMNMGGALDRERLRVAWLTLKHADGMGRVEWERRYYGWRLAELKHQGSPT